jgi:uncharacterized protein (DUF2344 family)
VIARYARSIDTRDALNVLSCARRLNAMLPSDLSAVETRKIYLAMRESFMTVYAALCAVRLVIAEEERLQEQRERWQKMIKGEPTESLEKDEVFYDLETHEVRSTVNDGLTYNGKSQAWIRKII